jgi:hypothetical protein
VCRGMPSCPWDTCGVGPGRGLVGFLWGLREAQAVELDGRSEAWCPHSEVDLRAASDQNRSNESERPCPGMRPAAQAPAALQAEEVVIGQNSAIGSGGLARDGTGV